MQKYKNRNMKYGSMKTEIEKYKNYIEIKKHRNILIWKLRHIETEKYINIKNREK